MKDKTEIEQETEIIVRTVSWTTTKTPDGEYRVHSAEYTYYYTENGWSDTHDKLDNVSQSVSQSFFLFFWSELVNWIFTLTERLKDRIFVP